FPKPLVGGSTPPRGTQEQYVEEASRLAKYGESGGFFDLSAADRNIVEWDGFSPKQTFLCR
ncbi:MAG: hypothetical protein KAZ26_16300, partial [Caldilineaceae bacterium]|nr:hypothetical protein [Caldilineaceae bacterium]